LCRNLQRDLDSAAVAGGLRRAIDLRGWLYRHGNREGFAADEVRVRADRVGHVAVGAYREPDSVGHREPCVAAGLLHDADNVARGSLGGQFGRDGSSSSTRPVLPGSAAVDSGCAAASRTSYSGR